MATILHPRNGKKMRTPIIVAADPGAERGYAMIDPEDMRVRRTFDAPRIVAMGTSVEELIDRTPAKMLVGRPVWAITEFQYSQRIVAGEISADSIIKLAFRAGWIVRDMMAIFDADEGFAAVPTQWKTEIYGTGASKRKDIFTNRLIRELMPDELKVVQKIEQNDDKLVDDVVDAIGIAWALWRVTCRSPKIWWEWRCDPVRVIPITRPPGMRRKLFETATRFNRTSFRPAEKKR